MGVPKSPGHWWKLTDGLGGVYESYAAEGSEHEHELEEAGFKLMDGKPRNWRRAVM